MKTYTYTPILLGFLLLACAPTMPPPPTPLDATALYSAAAAKHYQFAHGEIASTEAEWEALIEEFQRAINADAEGEWADDAQYAIASCWLWLGQWDEQPALDVCLLLTKCSGRGQKVTMIEKLNSYELPTYTHTCAHTHTHIYIHTRTHIRTLCLWRGLVMLWCRGHLSWGGWPLLGRRGAWWWLCRGWCWGGLVGKGTLQVPVEGEG